MEHGRQTMIAGREFETILLRSPYERPVLGSFKCLILGSIIAALLALINIVFHNGQFSEFFGCLLVGNGLMFFGWGADRLWHATVSAMLTNPFSFSAVVTRIPFWYFAGGIGYTLGLLCSKKMSLMDAQDIPVKELFKFGGQLGCAIQAVSYFLRVKKLMRIYLVDHRSKTIGEKI